MAAVDFRREALQQGEREPGGLAGAGLGGAKQIAAGEDDRNRLRLDGSGNGVALVGYRAFKLGGQAEAFKRRSNGFLLSSAWEGGTFDRFRQMLFSACYWAVQDGRNNGLRR
jgi:hypothetical protein